MKRALLLLAAACAPSRDEQLALARLTSPVANVRVEAVQKLRRFSGDDDGWAALQRAVRDGSPAVRSEVAAALGASGRDEAADALAPLLRDPDDGVRIAAAHALSAKCGDRSIAYLRVAFARSDAPVRAELAESLRKCGSDPAATLKHDEAERRRKAVEETESSAAAIRAHGAHELGLLGRGEDQQRLLELLDDRDGVVTAAAARALGEAGARQAAPRITRLLDEGGEVAAAAAEALLTLGPQAIAPARQKLAAVAVVKSDEAVPAAAALGPDCETARRARNPRAIALLAPDCPAALFVEPLSIDALLYARGDAPGLGPKLAKLLRGDPDARLPLLVRRYHVAEDALVQALRREHASRAVVLEQKREAAGDSDGSAAEIARASAPGAPSRERYARLMGLLEERAGERAVKASASTRLDALLNADPGSGRRAFVAAALRAAAGIKGAEPIVQGFRDDPDPVVAAAARGEAPGPPPPSKKAPASASVAAWSDDGAVRAAACKSADVATRRLLAASDPERRVRDACSATNETAPAK